MKRTKITLLVTLVLLIAFVMPARAASYIPATNAPVNMPVIPEDARVQQLLHRLKEIKDMDRSEMSRLERKAIRKEVTEIRKEMKKLSGGIYLSIGAIIIIVLLILIL